MKIRPILIIAVVSLTSPVWASGGLPIYQADKHVISDGRVDTNPVRSINTQPALAGKFNITPQAPVDKFNVNWPNVQKIQVETDKFKQSYDGNP